MVDVGGGTARHYRCSAAINGGSCSNRQTVREDALISSAVAELKRIMFTTKLHEQLKEKAEHRLRSLRGESLAEERRLVAHVAHLKAEVDRVVAFIRSMPATSATAMDALRSALEQATQQHQEADRRLEQIRRLGRNDVRVPSLHELMKIVLDVEARMKSDPTAAREALRKMLRDGRLEMHPLPGGAYKAKSMILMLDLPHGSTKPRGGGPSGASGVVGNDGCAGAIRGLDRGVEELFGEAFEVVLAA